MEEFKPTQETTRFSAPMIKLNYGEFVDGVLPIEGFAVHEGRFKEIVELPRLELSNVAKTLINAQLRIDHSSSVRDIVGLVDDSKVEYNTNAQKDGVRYKAHVDDAEIADGVNKNKIRDVSIGFDLDPECSKCGKDFRQCKHWFDEAHVIARNVRVHELSLVTRGADPDAHATAVGFAEQFSDKILKMEGGFEMPNTPDDKGGSFMEEDKTIDVVALTDKVTEAKQQALEAKQAQEAAESALQAMEAEKAQLETEKQALASEKAQLETEKTDLEGKFTEAFGKLTAQELEAKKEEATEIAELKAEKGIIKEEELDAEVEKLMKFDSLDEIKDLVTKFEVKEERGAEVPVIEGFEKFISEKGEIDYDSPELEQMMIHEIFAYDRVFTGEPGDKVVPGQTYVGFNLHK